MIWIIGVGLVIVLLWGGIRIEHAGKIAAQEQAKAAVVANESLAADCAAKISRFNAQIADIAKADQTRQARSRAARAAADKAAKAQQGQIDALAATAAAPAADTLQAQCEAAGAILRDVARVRQP